MAFTVDEKYVGVSVEEDSAREVIYIVNGTNDVNGMKETYALAALMDPAIGAPLTRDTFARADVLDARRLPRLEELADKVWIGTVKYISPEFGVAQPSASFDTGGGTVHITQAKKSINTYRFLEATGVIKTPGSLWDGAIGVGYGGGEVAGTDIVIPVLAYSERHVFPNSDVTDAFIGNIFKLTGRTNNAPYKSFKADECLFLGAAGGKESATGPWTIDYKWAGSPNVPASPGLTVGSITGIAKKGWEYLWAYYVPKDDTTINAMVTKVSAVVVEQVYDSDDFNLLGIGTARL